jgi:serine/threonine-protein kinase
MADVYLATDRTLGRQVAVKLLSKRYASDPTFIERFQREARAAARTSHPQVVNVFDVGVADGTAYLVMEYVPGATLRDLLRRRGPLPEREALDLAARLADGLVAAHRAGVIHRDIKPANVLLDADGRVKIADFGIARDDSATSTATTTSVMGSVHYMSPEQAQGHAVDPRTDVYSLGAVLFELLTGVTPFPGDSTVAVAVQHVHAIPRSPRAVRSDRSPASEAIVMRALAKNVADRFASASDMRDALTAAIARSGPSSPDSRRLSDCATASDPTVRLTRPPTRAVVAWESLSRLTWPGRAGILSLASVMVLVLTAAAIALAHAGSSDTAAHAAAGLPTIALTPSVADPGLTPSGPLVPVPDLSGASVERAATLLASAGLRLGGVDRVSNGAPPDQVVEQDPAPGQTVVRNSDVAVTLSAARPTETATVPTVAVGSSRGSVIEASPTGEARHVDP